MTPEIRSITHSGATDSRSPSCVLTEIEPILRQAGGQGTVCAMCLLLDNPALTSEFFADGQGGYEALFANTAYAHLIEASPYYRQTGPGQPFTRYLCEQRPAGFGWFAWGAGECKTSVAHWRSLLTVTMPGGTLTHFRFYSASVMANFITGCSPPEIALLLGPMAGLAIPLPDGTWLCVEHPGLAEHSAQDIARRYERRDAPWWRINEAQLAALAGSMSATLVANIRQDAWQNHPQWTEPFASFRDLDMFIASALNKAKDWGFTGDEQQTAFARLCLARNTLDLESIRPECGWVLHSAELSDTDKIDRLSELLEVVL